MSHGNRVHVRKGDMVKVIAGKDRGHKGRVLRVVPETGRVVVEGANIVKKHQRPTQKVMQGGIVDKEAPLASSNVMLYCSKCDQASRAGKKMLETGRVVRVCKRCGEVIDR
ncbi:MAG: 50S ribosomal protein L24 [Bacillota bacterium]